MGQNQVKKQKKYADYGKQIDKLELNFEQQRKNQFAEERQRDVATTFHSEQPRPLAASRLKKSTAIGDDMKRSVSAEKTLQALKFQRLQKQQRNDDPTLKKVREINRCQNVAYFFLNGLELTKVNCSLVNTIPMNYNIPIIQERKEETCCGKKKIEATEFLQYIEEKNKQEIIAIDQIDFEEMKQISTNFVNGYADDKVEQNSQKYDIFMQQKNQFEQQSRIERNKSPNKNSEVSQIIMSSGRNKIGSQNFYQLSDNGSISNIRKGRKSSDIYNDHELELNYEKTKQHKHSDNIELLANNKMKLSCIMKNDNNSDQASSHSSLMGDKKYQSNNRTDFKVFASTKENQGSKIFDQPKKSILNSPKKNSLGIEDENKLVTFSVNPEQNSKLQNTITNNQSSLRKNSNTNGNLKNVKNSMPEQNFQQLSYTHINQANNGQAAIKESIISETNKHHHHNANIYDTLQNNNKHYSGLNSNYHQNENNYHITINNNSNSNGINSYQNTSQIQEKVIPGLFENRQRLNSNMDFSEPQLKPRKNSTQKMQGLKQSGSVMNSENLSSNYIQEVSPSAALLIFDEKKLNVHEHSKMFQPSINIVSSYQAQEQNRFKINENGYIFDTQQNNNQQGQKDFITPQKINNFSTYIESTNIVKNPTTVVSSEQPKAVNNLFDINLENKNNNNNSYLASQQMQNFYPSNINQQNGQQRSRSSSNSNINQTLLYNKDSIKQQEERKFAPYSNIEPYPNSVSNLINAYKNGANDSKSQLNQNNYNSTQNNYIPAQNNYHSISYNPSSNQNEINNQNQTHNINGQYNNQSYNINESYNHGNNQLNGQQASQQKLDSNKDKKKIIQLNGKSYQSSNIKNQDSPLDHNQIQNVQSRKVSYHNNTLPTDKDHVQSLMNQRKQIKYSDDEQNLNLNSQYNPNNESTNLQSSNYLATHVKKFYEKKQEQLQRLSGSNSQSSSNKNQVKNSQASEINKYFQRDSNHGSHKKNTRNNMGASLSRMNQTQYENQFSEFDRHYKNKMSTSSISPSKCSQIIIKPKEGKFDDSFINKDYQEYIPEKVSTMSQIQSFTHIKSMIQETQLNNLRSTVKKNNHDDPLMQNSKLGSKIKQLSDERQYSPLASKMFLTSREPQRTHF